MVPRTDMLTASRDTPLRETLSLFLRSGYSRMPVIGDSSDEILGVLYLKDAMRAFILYSESPEGTALPTVVELMRPARFEPESKRAMDLLREMQRESTHVAIIVDEYGGTAGLITLEDLIEELVGDISDEYDHESPDYTLNDDGTFRLSARLGIDELGEIFGRELDDEDVDTVGGLLAKHLGMVPIIGSEVEIDGIHIRAIGSSGRRHQVDMLQAWYEPPRDERQNAEDSLISNSPESYSLKSEVADILTVDTDPPAVAEPHAHPDLPGDTAEAEPATDKHGKR
nr:MULTISPECIES: hemolysin family protein [unclassified Rothia (in: high G+C Gram-positive bacteria)]